MAYRTFGATDSLDSRDSPDAVAVEPPFAPLELQVIDLAEIDPIASIGVPGRFGRWFERWFGIERPKPLADDFVPARDVQQHVRLAGRLVQDVEDFSADPQPNHGSQKTVLSEIPSLNSGQ